MSKDVMRQALEALECSGEADDPGHRCGHCDDYVDRNGKVRAALRTALAEDAQPVAPFGWAIVDKHGREARTRARVANLFGGGYIAEPYGTEDLEREDREFPGLAPHRLLTLYTSPQPAAQPAEGVLTDEQLRVLRFLDGSGNLRGAGFGTLPEGVKAPYWWRTDLSAAFPQLRATPAPSAPAAQEADPLVQAARQAQQALQEIADDYADRFDMDSPSTNPGMKYVVQQAREAIAALAAAPKPGATDE